VVLAGQVTLELSEPLGPRVVSRCGPGDWFGELALLALGPRSADARVTMNARLLRIDRTHWTDLSARAPQLFTRLSQRLGTHLLAQNQRTCAPRRTVVALEDAESWLEPLLVSLRRQFPGREVQSFFHGPGPVEAALARLIAPDAFALVPIEVAHLADRRVRRTASMEWTIQPGRGERAEERVRGASTEAALARLARHLAGGTVGIALGAGGAFGLAHLGLLEVLERAGVPVDHAAGTSMGAIVGACVAAGVPMAQVVAYACEAATHYRTLVLSDLDLRGRTLLKGQAVTELIRAIDDRLSADFDDLHIPFAAVATDVATGEEVVVSRGSLLDGIRPSFAMPGILPLARLGDRVLMDGAMCNPVPVEQVRALGADVVLAAQPIPQLTPGSEPAGGLVGYASWLAGHMPIPGLRHTFETLDLSLRSFQSLWYHLASASALAADAILAPDVSSFWFLGFGEAARIIDAGRAHGEAMLPTIRATLRERTGLVIDRECGP
jgi:NTE family protein